MNRLQETLFIIAAMVTSIVGSPGCTDNPLGGTSGDGARNDLPNTRTGVAIQQEICPKPGMTWRWVSRTADVDTVGSDGITNPYTGDTSCETELPILCIRKVGAGQPYYITSSFYSGWTGGYISMTRAHSGFQLWSPEAADSICANELGAGWEMAEFHDGNGGWNFQAFGAATHIQRFWVMINDQPANCWNSACF